MTRTIDIGARVKKITKRKKSFPTRTVTSAKRAATYKFRGKMKNKVREFRASEALRSIFSHNNNGKTTNRKILGKGYGILSYLTYSLNLIKCYLTIIFYFSSPPSFVYIGNSGFLENKNELKKLWNGIPREFLNCDDLNSKGFKRIKFTALMEANGGRAFVISILKLLKPLFSGYSVEHNDPLHVIVSKGNTNPWHQDRVTGCRVYNQSYQKDQDGYLKFGGKYYLRPAHGIRVLIDLGSFSKEHDSRQFSFKMGEKKVLNTEARVIAMNAGAAGSGRKNQIYHGRIGDGVTVQLDLIHNKTTRSSGKAKTVGVGGVIKMLISRLI